jgi:hypothetical protein
MKKIPGIIAIFTFAAAFNSCLSFALSYGTDKLVKETSNNDHTKKAILFLREAGATVADSYQISIIGYKTEFDTTSVGNAFSVDDNHGKTYLNPKAINLNWLSSDTIEISYDKNLRTFIQERLVGNVTVVYKVK